MARGISNPLTVIEQISYLLFIKRLDDIDNANEKRANRMGKSFKSLFMELNEKLKENALEGVISMPSGVFKPYAGVSTAILLLTNAESIQR